MKDVNDFKPGERVYCKAGLHMGELGSVSFRIETIKQNIRELQLQKELELVRRSVRTFVMKNLRPLEKQVDDVLTLAPLYVKKPTPVIKLEQGTFEKQG